MQSYNDTPTPSLVTLQDVTPGPNSGFIHASVLYWRAAINQNINTVNGGVVADADFGADLVDRKNLVGIHYATPAV